MSTLIQWTDVTDNIIVVEGGGWWCRMISEGCVNCYAARLNQSSYFGGNKLPYTGEPPKLKLRTDVIHGWKTQRKPRRHFVASMTDVFGDWVPFEWAVVFLRGMWCAPKQTFQVLTKRPDIAADYISRWLKLDMLSSVPDNIWIGASVENKKWADIRIPELLKIPAKVRFLSCEPLLGPIEFSEVTKRTDAVVQLGKKAFDGIHWVIVGGESGHGARPCHVDWIRSIVNQCKASKVPVFVKQLGAKPQYFRWEDKSICEFSERPDGALKDKKGGNIKEFPKDLQVRQFPDMNLTP